MEDKDSTGQFSRMPLFAGPDHLVEWPEPSGSDPSPLSIDSGLTLENLSLPSSTSSLPTNVSLDDPEQALLLIDQFYDDLAHTCPGPEYAKRWIEQRMALERAYFKGGKSWTMKQRKIPMREMPKCLDQGWDAKFSVKYVTPDYALAVQTVFTDEVARECARIEESNAHFNFLARVEGMKRRIDEAPNSAACKEILEQMQALLENYIKAKTKREEYIYRGLVKKCQDRLKQFPPETDDAAFAAEPDKDKTETETETATEPEPEKTETAPEGKEPEPARQFPRKLHHVGCVLYTAALEQDGKSRIIFPSDETLARLRNYGLDDPEYAEPAIVDPDTDKPVTTFDRTRGSAVRGTLYGMTLANDAVAPSWHSLDVEMMLPCAVNCLGDEAVVADHERVRVLKMPTGKPTGEEYWLTPDPTRSRWNTPRSKTPEPELIHVSDCRISSTHLAVTGVLRGQNKYVLMTVERGQKKKAAVAIYTSAIPLSAIALPPDGQTVLVGFKDGTILRWPHPATSGVRVYAPTQQTYDVTKDTPLPKKQELVAYDRDLVMFCGTNVGINDIIVRGKRVLASSTSGLHLFRPFMFEEEARAVHMPLHNNASFDLCGNILAIQKMDNSVMLVNTVTYTLEVQVAAPTLDHKPPDINYASSTISIRDRRITFFHLDGSMRVIELNNYLDVAPPRPETKTAAKTKKTKTGRKTRKK